jgi:N-sulfoglucosamine sulfohydrolase
MCRRVLVCIALLCGVRAQAHAAPNVLIIMADDCTYSDLPLYGGQNVKTPNIDRLASEGLTFNQAFLCMSMCVPCRSALNTGLYSIRNGAAWNHSSTHPGTKSVVHHLGSLGYRCGVAGKVHMTPRDNFPFEMVEGFDRNCVRIPTKPHDTKGIREFMTRDKARPFYLVVALVEPHVPWVMGDAKQFAVKKLKLPPHLADTEQTRKDFAAYLAEIAYMDRQVGDVLETLDASGQADNTMVIFTSEQGAQFPGCKWTCWEQGLHTGFVVRWPGVTAAGKRVDALVQYVDVLPTLLEAAGAKPKEYGLDGYSFLSVMRGESEEHRRYVFGLHNNVPEGPPYPVRTVRDAEYRYIRNLRPNDLYIEKHLMGRTSHNPYWPTWVWAATTDPRARMLVNRFMRRPPEELYHTAEDPFEHTNLAADPRYADVKARLSAELDRWMKEQGDPGVHIDTIPALEANRAAVRKAKK